MADRLTEHEARTFLQQLAKRDWLQGTECRWWPQFAFHYTDIRNAVSVLQDGRLYSRLQAAQQGKMAVSSGSDEVLAGTDVNILDCVRLYFRPKTPTQFWAEGVHSRSSLSQSKFPDAHCPVPVFLLLDLAAVLGLPDSLFSDRGLGARNYRLGRTLAELKSLPWRQIYHNTWIDWSDPDSAHEVIACRNAEIVVPRQLDLSALKYIYCRSEAEKDTLIHLLPVALRKQYRNKIVASTRNELFFRQRTFIERAVLMNDRIYLRFSPDTKAPGPFHLRVEISAGRPLLYERSDFRAPPHDYSLSLSGSFSAYDVRVTLDDHLVYANAFVDVDMPF
ncbi:MAG TPA: hypothetical protein DCL15_11525 [Chloroflexi bacterium]|nr:hypothetical protein [Chloroflexota bacterium]